MVVASFNTLARVYGLSVLCVCLNSACHVSDVFLTKAFSEGGDHQGLHVITFCLLLASLT